MPKMKTNSGAKKRFKKTKSGKIKFNHAKRSHILSSKTTKKKRKLRKASYVDKSNEKAIEKLLPYS
ncbi:MAG: 50S ribosomal protein L35 [Deltaproteobacteria bacterium]|jgi:large subunit ribosomal protein L35|nr:50S ribosomal protein L35 [Deltaproteobacteria bacterium]